MGALYICQPPRVDLSTWPGAGLGLGLLLPWEFGPRSPSPDMAWSWSDQQYDPSGSCLNLDPRIYIVYNRPSACWGSHPKVPSYSILAEEHQRPYPRLFILMCVCIYTGVAGSLDNHPAILYPSGLVLTTTCCGSTTMTCHREAGQAAVIVPIAPSSTPLFRHTRKHRPHTSGT